MKIERTLKKVGGSVMVPIPAEILRELRWEPGLKVSVNSEDGVVRVEPAAERPPDDIALSGCRTPISGAYSSRIPCSSSGTEARRG